jgi:hypothetical protein
MNPTPRIEILGWAPLSLRDGWQFSAVEEILLVEFESSWISRAVPQGQGPPAQGFNPGSRFIRHLIEGIT